MNKRSRQADCFVTSLSFWRSLDHSREHPSQVPGHTIRRLGVTQLGKLSKKRLVRDLFEQRLEPAREQRFMQSWLESVHGQPA
jgi:hypothetical protein